MGFDCNISGLNSKTAQINVFDTNLPFQLDLLLLFFQTPGAGKLTYLPPTLLGLSKLIASAHTSSLQNTILIVFCPIRTQSLQNQHKSHLLDGTIPVLASILCEFLLCRNHTTEHSVSLFPDTHILIRDCKLLVHNSNLSHRHFETYIQYLELGQLKNLDVWTFEKLLTAGNTGPILKGQQLAGIEW